VLKLGAEWCLFFYASYTAAAKRAATKATALQGNEALEGLTVPPSASSKPAATFKTISVWLCAYVCT
jgi:hypothetical protein